MQSRTYHSVKHTSDVVSYTFRDEGTYEASTKEHGTSVQLQRLSRNEVDH